MVWVKESNLEILRSRVDETKLILIIWLFKSRFTCKSSNNQKCQTLKLLIITTSNMRSTSNYLNTTLASYTYTNTTNYIAWWSKSLHFKQTRNMLSAYLNCSRIIPQSQESKFSKSPTCNNSSWYWYLVILIIRFFTIAEMLINILQLISGMSPIPLVCIRFKSFAP